MPAPGSTVGPYKPGAPALWIGAAVAAVVGALLVLAGARVFGPRPPESPVRRIAIPVPGLAAGPDHPVRLSPDGRAILYASGTRVLVRELGRFEAREVAGAEGAESFAWSPDSRRIAYFKSGKIWVSDPTGERAASIGDVAGGEGVTGADWGTDGTIVFACRFGGLYLAAASGGEARALLMPDAGEIHFHDPQFLPDGRHVVAVARRKEGLNAAIVVSYPEGVRTNLGEFEHLSAVRYAPTGHLFLTFENGEAETRVAPFSISRLEIAGPPVLALAGGLFPSLTRDGALCCSSARPTAGDSTRSGILLVENWAGELQGGGAGPR